MIIISDDKEGLKKTNKIKYNIKKITNDGFKINEGIVKNNDNGYIYNSVFLFGIMYIIYKYIK